MFKNVSNTYFEDYPGMKTVPLLIQAIHCKAIINCKKNISQ